ncbi:hypothetical protein ACIBKY_37160 [Nonomuraea sp. NPDC050394]|uniref:hypothetical protein n=1 Tax=Nonomuraea sp. NPDC050394 TaxID=3364363 RepID=UPI0037A6BC6C
MTKEYASLVAQVVPVLLLALLLETRAILTVAREEWVRFGIPEKFRLLSLFRAVLSPRTYIPRRKRRTWTNRSAAVVRWSRPVHKTAGREKTGLGPVDALGFIIFNGTCMIWLGRGEIVALAAAQGKSVPSWEVTLLHLGLVVSLVQVVVIPIGLEVYARLSGASWRFTDWAFATIVGLVAFSIVLYTGLAYLI